MTRVTSHQRSGDIKSRKVELGDIKSREVEPDSQENPGEIESREVEPGSQENPVDIKSREVELRALKRTQERSKAGRWRWALKRTQ